VNAAEQWGLDANFAPDRWVLASPLILAAAIAQRTRRMKTLEIVKRAWTEERFSYRGKYFAHDKVALVRKPRQKPSISADPHRCHEHRYLALAFTASVHGYRPGRIIWCSANATSAVQ